MVKIQYYIFYADKRNFFLEYHIVKKRILDRIAYLGLQFGKNYLKQVNFIVHFFFNIQRKNECSF